jgi:hypothetical protein
MTTPNQASSLLALRELRDMERGAESSQLPLDLEGARLQIARLRLELARAQQLQAQATPTDRHLTWVKGAGWLGLSAGVTMLVGAFALWAAMGSQELPKLTVEVPSQACPEQRREGMAGPGAVALPEPRLEPPAKPVPHGRRPSAPHPQAGAKPASVTCDGRDPLCGLDLGAIDDEVGKNHGHGRKK